MGEKLFTRMWKMLTTMLNTFFDIKGMVHFEFIPQGQTVNQAYYVEILTWLHEAMHRKTQNCDNGTESYSTTRAPKMFLTVAASLG
jgi:hypothetical protein